MVDSGYVYIIDGGSSGLSSTGDQGIDQDVTDVADTAQTSDQLGLRLETVRVDGDPYHDLWVTVPGDGCSTSAGWGRHQFRGGSGGLSFTDDVVDCDDFGCDIAGGTYECENAQRPVHGSALADDVFMYYGSDVAIGWGGDDQLTGSLGRDILVGGLGNDTLDGGASADLLIGGAGDDAFWLDLDCEIDPGDVVDGGPGTDTVYSHLSESQLVAAGVTLVSIEHFVSVSQDSSDEEYTCGLPELTGAARAGYACFDLGFRCERPEFASLKRDGVVIWHWGGAREDETSSIPESTCVDTDDVTAGNHSFTLTQGCAGGAQTSLPLALSTQENAVDIAAIKTDKLYYEAGDTLVVTILTSSTGLVPSVDFSAIDTGYTTGAESVVEVVSGEYEISYTLSTANSAKSADIYLPYVLRAATGAALRSGRIKVRYLPDGPMGVVVAGGVFRAAPPPTRRVDGSVSILSVTNTGNDTTSHTFDESLPDFSNPSNGISARPGRIFEVEVQTTGATPRPLAAVIADTEGSGHYTVPLTPTSETCGGSTCTYVAPVVIAHRTLADLDVDLDLEVVDFHAGTSSGPDAVLHSDVEPDWEYKVSGVVVYEATPLERKCDEANIPEYQCSEEEGTETLRIPEGMIIRLVTACSEPYFTFVDPSGYFELPFNSVCGDQPALLRATSWLEPAPYPISVFDRAVGQQFVFTLGYDEELAPAMTNNPNDYRTYHEFLTLDLQTNADSFIPDNEATIADPLVILTELKSDPLANAVYLGQMARESLAYQGQWTTLEDTHAINILMDYDEVSTKWNPKTMQDEYDNTAQYRPGLHPGYIHIPPALSWSAFAIQHEMGHYLHEFWTAEGDSFYGRFGEPMSHVHAVSVARTN